MGILHLKWITENDEDLKDLRLRFVSQYSNVVVGKVRPERGTAYRYSDYFIQLIPDDFPPCIHFEYWADTSQGFLDLHLEPNRENPDELKVYRTIGINLMHILCEHGIDCSSRWMLPYGCFRISGIRSVDDLVKRFDWFFGIVKEPLKEIYEAKKGAFPLKLQYPNRPIEYNPLHDGAADVSVRIMKLSEVMNLKLSLPPYQRDYCWEDKNITDLWNNLKKIQDEKPFHLGTIILHDYNQRYDIIDGQQRLITLSIMLLAMGYGGYLPLLNESYDSSDAQDHVANCKYIVQTLVGKEMNNMDLAKRIAENVSFSVLSVNEANLDLAYTFFSNQNSKGVPLSDFDLLKAHHLRFISKDEQASHIAVKWNKMMMMPPVYKKKNALHRVLGTHIYRLRRWMGKNESFEGQGHYIHQEYQSAATLPDIPSFGEKFDFYEKIQGGTHFFVYAETFIHHYQEFLNIPLVETLRTHLGWGSFEIYFDGIETILFGYYLKFGNQYLAEALYCVLQTMALHRYNSARVSADGTGVRSFINETEFVLMIDQASSPTFFLAEALSKYERLSQKEDWIKSGLDLPEIKGLKWSMYNATKRIFNTILPEISESIIRKKILEEYGR